MDESISLFEKHKFEILEFRKINKFDFFDEKYNDGYAWSRGYEYPLVSKTIEKYFNGNKDISIHNTSWGFEGLHIIFKDYLDSIYSNCIHSDILKSDLPKTTIYDITEFPNLDLVNKFDVVINVSTVEEVHYNHLIIINNLFSQLKNDGLLIITFDIPGFDLNLIKNEFDLKLIDSDDDISVTNSKVINTSLGHLNCGILVVKKRS